MEKGKWRNGSKMQGRDWVNPKTTDLGSHGLLRISPELRESYLLLFIKHWLCSKRVSQGDLHNSPQGPRSVTDFPKDCSKILKNSLLRSIQIGITYPKPDLPFDPTSHRTIPYPGLRFFIGSSGISMAGMDWFRVCNDVLVLSETVLVLVIESGLK
jgi:hypothetical protein